MTNGMFDEIVQQIIIKSNKIRIDLGGKHHPSGRYCYIWVETEHFNLIYVNLNNNKNKSYKTTNYNYSIWAFGLETGSGVPLMMEEISYQSPQQQHAWIQHATRILWESLGQLQPHTHGNQRHQQLLQSYLSIQKTVRLFNKTWSSLEIITLQCRLTFMSVTQVHIFVLGHHLGFGNCGGLERGNIWWGSFKCSFSHPSLKKPSTCQASNYNLRRHHWNPGLSRPSFQNNACIAG